MLKAKSKQTALKEKPYVGLTQKAIISCISYIGAIVKQCVALIQEGKRSGIPLFTIKDYFRS